MRSIVGIAATLSTVALVAACSSSQSDSSSTNAGAPITVFAAASLTATFTELGARFERENPGATVAFNFAGSSDLATQLTQGAPADVFASADVNNMTKAVDPGLVAGEPVNFATNSLTIVTRPGNPTGIDTFADLAKPGTQVVVCAPQVPCGAATEKVERATGVTLTPVSEESAVTDVLGKVTSGQADAGLVYVTDAVGARDDVTAIPFTEAGDAVNTYPITVLEDSPNPVAAQAFVDLITGPAGQEVLAAAGFAAP
ncbi:molybdate ABC transporter substrate-binding protein [Mycobacterium sp. CPCC 205372]|uniref:Molybdate ABC transporter substrate-binding protein n=1 Tax=Mycobacterium hippophais TaxID=3016340 RepID=A0ABT4PX61_9MYCO|nr:molybdate ABC transporter substrate-binding protein [Mycobacterium hippophais]MCZ8381160.1 molybdate ABC transporter substrate-binding protein [Mycobacterium hippophais]